MLPKARPPAPWMLAWPSCALVNAVRNGANGLDKLVILCVSEWSLVNSAGNFLDFKQEVNAFQATDFR